MSSLKRTLIGTLALALLAMPVAPHRAAAQTGTKTYEITVTNITTSMQGLSPLVIATHPASVHAWQMGQLASKGLELLAEEGMPDTLASELKGSATDVQVTHAHLLPGDSITVRIAANDGDVLSAASMLIQTNDGFTGLDGVAIADGDKDTNAYDAGTEENTEAASDVPGPPFGGKNSGPDSNPHQPISAHQGIKGTAQVTPEFNWTGPVARFTIRTVDTSVVPTNPLYDVTVTNINNSKQGLSPLVLATHPASVHAWQMGQLASKGLELVAEEGMPDTLASELKGAATDVQVTHAHLLPGDSITVRIMAKPGDMLSAATMLIQTNDGFTGLDSLALTNAASMDTNAYDAGTEENTEAASDVPGPPFGGKNSGPDSNPHQPISAHQGIKGTGQVTPDFNWTGPVARFEIVNIAASSSPVEQPTQPTATPVSQVLPEAAPPSAPPTSGSSNPMPGMPETGLGDASIWLIAVLASVLALGGLALRRVAAYKRR
jgi:hypothetical protein